MDDLPPEEPREHPFATVEHPEITDEPPVDAEDEEDLGEPLNVDTGESTCDIDVPPAGGDRDGSTALPPTVLQPTPSTGVGDNTTSYHMCIHLHVSPLQTKYRSGGISVDGHFLPS